MARSRNIKPGFFTNDQLAEIEPLGRILFIGLWTIADREGRMEDRPRRIKAELLPYDDADVDSLLQQLEQQGFILRYSSGENRFIQVLNFGKHQNPHVKESASTIPAPDQHRAGTVPDPARPGENPADSLNLIPDSGSRIPDPGGAADADARAQAPETPPADPEPKAPKTKRARQLPPDWQVSDSLRDWAHKSDFTDQDLAQEEPKFVAYWLSRGEPRKDWDAGFRLWMQNARQYGHLVARPRSSPPKSGDRITSIEELFATGADDEHDRDREQEDFGDIATSVADDRTGQAGSVGVDPGPGRDGFRALAGGRR